MNTPWGPSEPESETTYAEGIVGVSTASHGGIKVFGPALEQLSKEARLFGIRLEGALFYEEDCDWAIVVREIPDAFDDSPEKVTASLERWNKPYLRLVANQ